MAAALPSPTIRIARRHGALMLATNEPHTTDARSAATDATSPRTPATRWDRVPEVVWGVGGGGRSSNLPASPPDPEAPPRTGGRLPVPSVHGLSWGTEKLESVRVPSRVVVGDR
jgi:hypothetical protein